MIDIVPHRPSWSLEFQGIAAAIRAGTGEMALRVDHIGSTAVPRLCAKDVLDLQVTVERLDGGIAEGLRRLGFVPRPEIEGDHVPPGYAGPRSDWAKLFFVQPSGQRRINVHVRQAGRPNQRYALLFRDYLVAHPQAAAAYGELKRRLAASLASEDAYADVKDPAVDLIYFAAEEWAARSQPDVFEAGNARPEPPLMPNAEIPAGDSIRIREAGEKDALCLHALATQVFLETYATQGIREALAREARAAFSVAAFLEQLRAPSVRVLLAERNGHLLGFASVTGGATHALVADGIAAELTRLYVQPRFIRRGAGSLLLRHAEAFARASGASTLWLTAWVGNTRALRFYASQGYEERGCTEHAFENERFENRLFAKALVAET